MFLTLALVPFLFVAGQDVATPAPDELRTSYNNLKAAEESKDADLIKKHAIDCSRLAREVINSKEPPMVDQVEAWKARLGFAKEVETYADYAIYTAALRARGPKMMELFETLQTQSPNSQYVPQLYAYYIGALATAGQANKAFEFASKAIAKDPNNEDLLAVLADGAMARKQFEKAATYGNKLASVMGSHPRPDGMPAGDWEKRRTALLGRGHYIAGLSYASVNKFTLADKSLRAALPYINDEPQLVHTAKFYLGLADYNLARMTQDKMMLKAALQFSEEAFKMGGPYAQLASQNMYAIKQELTKWR